MKQQTQYSLDRFLLLFQTYKSGSVSEPGDERVSADHPSGTAPSAASVPQRVQTQAAATQQQQVGISNNSSSLLSIGGDDDSNSSFVVNLSMADEFNLCSECVMARWTCV